MRGGGRLRVDVGGRVEERVGAGERASGWDEVDAAGEYLRGKSRLKRAFLLALDGGGVGPGRFAERWCAGDDSLGFTLVSTVGEGSTLMTGSADAVVSPEERVDCESGRAGSTIPIWLWWLTPTYHDGAALGSRGWRCGERWQGALDPDDCEVDRLARSSSSRSCSTARPLPFFLRLSSADSSPNLRFPSADASDGKGPLGSFGGDGDGAEWREDRE